jgi:hypothetical protein
MPSSLTKKLATTAHDVRISNVTARGLLNEKEYDREMSSIITRRTMVHTRRRSGIARNA